MTSGWVHQVAPRHMGPGFFRLRVSPFIAALDQARPARWRRWEVLRMTLDQAVALSLLENLTRVGLTERLMRPDAELLAQATPLLERARQIQERAARGGS